MSKLSFRARALDASKPMPIYLAEELPDLPDYSAINRAVPQMPSGMEKEEESEHHLQRAISGTGLIIPTPEVTQVCDIDFYEKCYPPDYKMPKQHIHMQPLWEEQEAPEYDMDSDDERWLKQQRHPELTELKFEQMMDKLEKSSGQTVVTLNEAKLLLERQDDLVIAVYDYWLNKRLTTQHPLILSVRTENRPGQSSNNPYLAFRRRTEKMQTRKNRKNDESSYEKMLKLRRDLARALNLLELVARRERAKRELVKLTALLAERRYEAGDFANQMLPDPPPRPSFTAVPLNAFRPEKYSAPHYPPRPQPAAVDAPRQREKRPYKRRKHRHAPVGSAQGLRDSGVYTSSEEESPRVEPASPPDDGPFAFRRKPGCFYEMPTSTLCGDPVDPDDPTKEGLFQHELDPRHRYTLTSINQPYRQCVGFARRRIGRGGRVVLDRLATPLDDLWNTLPFHMQDQTDIQQEIENKRHRTPKEITTDYHTSGKYPWRHAFRRHLARNQHLWTDAKPDVSPIDVKPIKSEFDVKLESYDSNFKMDLPDVVQDSEKCCDNSVRTRKRSYSDCSDSSYDSDESLQPVEHEFEQFIEEVNKKWLHFRARSPSSPPALEPYEEVPLEPHTALSVELCGTPSDGLTSTTEFSLMELGSELDRPLYNDTFTDVSVAEMQSMLFEPSVAPTARNDPFLLHGQSAEAGTYSGRNNTTDSFGSSQVRVIAAERETIYCAAPLPARTLPQTTTTTTTPTTTTPTKHTPKKVVESRPLRVESTPATVSASAPAAAPKAHASNELPNSSQNQTHIQSIQINSHQITHLRVGQGQRKKEDNVEEVQVPTSVQINAVHSVQSAMPVHIMVGGARRSEPVAVSSEPHHNNHNHNHNHNHKLKVRLQNHLLSTQGGVMMQNGPFPQVVSLPVQSRDNMASITSIAGVSVDGSGRRVSTAPLVQLAPASVHKAHAAAATQPAPLLVTHAHTHTHTHTHLQPKLKVLHAHPLTHTQRTQLLAQNRGITQLPAVVSLATLSDPKQSTLFKAAPGSVAQLFEIKSGQLGKGPHLVNVLRQPTPPRLEMKPKLVFDGTLKGNIQAPTRPHRVSVSLDARHLVRAPLQAGAVRAPHQRHQIHLKNRTFQGLQVTAPQLRNPSEPSTSITIAAPQAKTTSIPSSVVANLLQKNVSLPKGGQKIAISGPGGQALSANVQAIAFTAAQLKARQTRHIPQPRPTPTEIAEATTTPVPTSSQQSQDAEETETNGAVRRRTGDTLPMEVT